MGVMPEYTNRIISLNLILMYNTLVAVTKCDLVIANF
jgi:hypothetical protein